MPFVVVRISVGAFGGCANSRGEAPTSKPSTTTAFRSPPTTASSPSSARSALRLLDLGAAEHALVARRERLGDRRGRADDVDDDADAGGSFLLGSESDVDAHPDTLAAWTNRATATGIPTARPGLSCSECGRPICYECMTPAPVGLRCPEHSGKPQGVQKVTRRRSAPSPGVGSAALNAVTMALIAINVAVVVAELAIGGRKYGTTNNAIFEHGVLSRTRRWTSYWPARSASRTANGGGS